MLIFLFGALSVALQCLRSVPQVVDLLRSKNSAGVSVATWAVGLFSGLVWLSWGLANHLWAQVLGNALVALGSGVVLAGCWPSKRAAVLRATVLALIGFVLVLLLGLLAAWLLSAVALAVAMLGTLPQVIEVLRDSDLGGVSVWSWLLSGANAVTWTVYGALVGSWVTMAPGVVVLPSCLFIAWKAHRFLQGARAAHTQAGDGQARDSEAAGLGLEVRA